MSCAVMEVAGAVGGGTYPGVDLPSWAVVPQIDASVDDAAERLRTGTPAVIGRIVEDRLALDVRTVAEGEEEDLLVRRLLELRASPAAK